jgi:hypothetical protein
LKFAVTSNRICGIAGSVENPESVIKKLSDDDLQVSLEALVYIARLSRILVIPAL